MPPPIPPPNPQQTLTPLLASLPTAAVSSSPPAALLPILSPILRQRVQVLSATASSNEPWLPLLCYNDAKTIKLAQIAKSQRLEAHPISGEVEIDWDSDVDVRFRRVDQETLHAWVLLRELELVIKHVWCENDAVEGGSGKGGWRVGEVGVLDPMSSSTEEQQFGYDSIGEAEGRFKEGELHPQNSIPTSQAPAISGGGLNGEAWQRVNHNTTVEEDEDDDAAYWAQYDNTPARTPAIKRSPAPDSLRNGTSDLVMSSSQAQAREAAEEEAYFSQYAQVQPAMDNHDPDEAKSNGHIESTLGNGGENHANGVNHMNGNGTTTDTNLHAPHLSSSDLSWSQDQDSKPQSQTHSPPPDLAHPRPASSSGSSGSITVERLEREAAATGQSEFGIKQHISTSVKSLYRLAKAAGIERDEFERLVRTELDCLGLLDVE